MSKELTLGDVIQDLLKRATREDKKKLEEIEARLTQKQLAFCLFYIANPNAAEAARNAGYSKSHARTIGSENLTKPDIKSYIHIFTKIQDDKRVASAQETLELITRIARGEDVIPTRRIVTKPGETTITVEDIKPSHMAKNMALKQLMQYHGLLDNTIADLRDAEITITIGDKNYEDLDK